MRKEKIYPPHVLKNNSNRKKQFILLMIPIEEKRGVKSEGQWNDLAVRKLSVLSRGIT